MLENSREDDMVVLLCSVLDLDFCFVSARIEQTKSDALELN
jgi:hypothetical protein